VVAKVKPVLVDKRGAMKWLRPAVEQRDAMLVSKLISQMASHPASTNNGYLHARFALP
jgi:hypothetical protein